MRLESVNLEEYQKLSDKELRNVMIAVQMQLKKVQREQDEDKELQAAIAFTQSLKMKYSLKIQQLKKLQKSLSTLAELRDL